MMTYEMNLNRQPFDMIKSGRKTIELRLNDEKRKNIVAGDKIKFTSPCGDTMLCIVKHVSSAQRVKLWQEMAKSSLNNMASNGKF